MVFVMFNLCFKNFHLIRLNIERIIPKSLQISGAANFRELRMMYKKFARADKRVAAIGAVVMLTWQLQSCDRGRRIASFVRLVLKAIITK